MEPVILKAGDHRVGTRSPEEIKWPAIDVNRQEYRKETASTHDIGNEHFVVFSRESPLPKNGIALEGSQPAPVKVEPPAPPSQVVGRGSVFPPKSVEDSEAKGQ